MERRPLVIQRRRAAINPQLKPNCACDVKLQIQTDATFVRGLPGAASLTSAEQINRIAFLNFCNTICQ
jgi:hypothetical protein